MTRGITQVRNRSIFIRMLPYSPQRLFWVSQLLFWPSQIIQADFSHLGRRLTGRERDAGMILRVLLGLYVQERASLPAPVHAPLLPSLPFSFFRHFTPFSTFFLCLLTGLPGFSSNRCNTAKHLRGRKRDQKMCKTSQNEPI